MAPGSGAQASRAPLGNRPTPHVRMNRLLSKGLLLVGVSAALTACNASRFRSTKAPPNSSTNPSQSSGLTPTSPIEPSAAPTDVGGGVLSQPYSDGQRTAFIAELLAGLARGLLTQPEGTTLSGGNEPQTEARDRSACLTRTDAGRPVDVVFNVDVSNSMDPYIALIKDNIDRLVSALGRKDADARVGAVGYVNRVELSLEPTTIEGFRSTFGTWRTMVVGGDGLLNSDMQEAGQAGLEQSLFLLGARGRSNALKVLIHISDAIAFAGKSHTDFSTASLGEAMRAAKLRYGTLLFFDSVPSTPGETGDPLRKVLTSFSPQNQIDELRMGAGGLEGSSLGFPFTAEAMTGEIPISIARKLQSMCQQQ